MAGMLEAKKGGEHLIHEATCTITPGGLPGKHHGGNDRSGTVDNNLNLLKAVELALTGGVRPAPLSPTR
jgi:trans-4-hydroxy-L-proline dehydratase